MSGPAGRPRLVRSVSNSSTMEHELGLSQYRPHRPSLPATAALVTNNITSVLLESNIFTEDENLV